MGTSFAKIKNGNEIIFITVEFCDWDNPHLFVSDKVIFIVNSTSPNI